MVVYRGSSGGSICGMLDPAAHCPGASYSCWELLGHRNASAHALLTQSCFKGCQKSVGKNILYHPKIPFKKSLFFWRRQPPQLPCIAILVSWYHLLNNCVCCYSCPLVRRVLPGPLRGLEFSWPGIWCRNTFTVPHPLRFVAFPGCFLLGFNLLLWAGGGRLTALWQMVLLDVSPS